MYTYFDKSLEKLQDEGNQQHRLMDLAMAELPYVDEKRLKKLFEFVSKNVEVHFFFAFHVTTKIFLKN